MGVEKIKKKMIEGKINKKIQKLLIEATNHHKNNRLEDLEKVLRKIILIDPNYFPAFFNLARLFEMSKKFEEAIKLYKKTLEINPNHLESILNLINCYEDINELDKALKISEDSCKLHPDKYEVHYTLGRLTRKKGRNLDKAYNAYKKTLSINSNFKFAKIGLGQIYKSKGNFSEAKKTFQKIIDSDGNEIRAYYEIADFLNDKEIKKNIKSLKILENDNKQKYGNKIYLYFTMGKLFEKINKYDKAIHYYNLGNNLKRKQINYSIDYDEKKFDALKKTIDKFGANKKRNIGHKSSRPIFIVGMPRSGTTLIEQIISSHSKIFGGGELFLFTEFVQKELNLENNKNFLEILNNLTEKSFFNIGKIYIDEIEKISKKNKYLTNKLPGNFINIGLIKLSLPNAKIIHCERNPLDTCFSCYKTFFTQGHAYCYSLEELTSFYMLYEKQMEYYKKIFGKQILNVKYEDVINNVKNETKKILDYLDLSFEESCLEFYKNKRPIQTASLVQARKPVFKSSINCWMKYKNFLKPLTDKLNI